MDLSTGSGLGGVAGSGSHPGTLEHSQGWGNGYKDNVDIKRWVQCATWTWPSLHFTNGFSPTPQYLAQGLKYVPNKTSKNGRKLSKSVNHLSSFSRWEIWGSEMLSTLPEITQLGRAHLPNKGRSCHSIRYDFTEQRGTISARKGKLQGC